MPKLPFDQQVPFFKFYHREISILDLETWLYTNKELESYLGNDSYVELVSINYKDRYAEIELHKIIDPFLEFGRYEELRIRKILGDLIERKAEFAKSLISTYELYCSGYQFFDNLGLGYGLTFSEDFWNYNDWEKLSPEQQSKRIDEIHLGVKKEAEMVLKWLDEGTIILNIETNKMDHHDYIDHRTTEERKTRTLETVEHEKLSFLRALCHRLNKCVKQIFTSGY